MARKEISLKLRLDPEKKGLIPIDMKTVKVDAISEYGNLQKDIYEVICFAEKNFPNRDYQIITNVKEA